MHNIYLIDDNHAFHLITEEALNKLNLSSRLFSFYDGEKALAFLSTYSDENQNSSFPSLILLDLNYSNISGVQMIEGIRKIHLFDKVPLIILTNDLYADRKMILSLKANDLVNKSWGFNETVESYKNILEKHGIY